MLKKSLSHFLLTFTICLIFITFFLFVFNFTETDLPESNLAVQQMNLQACPPQSNNPNCLSPTPLTPTSTLVPPTPTPVPPTSVLSATLESTQDYRGGTPNPNKRATKTAEVSFLLTSYQLSVTSPNLSGQTPILGQGFESNTPGGDNSEPPATPNDTLPENPSAGQINSTLLIITALVLGVILIAVFKLRR